MTLVSPSSKKVDEFLSSLSQISQDRLRDNHKTQRELQRDIDELRRSTSPYSSSESGRHTGPNDHGITELKFNRSARGEFFEKWKDSAPELPKRPDEEGPPLPTRPKPAKPEKPPKMPTRPAPSVELKDTVLTSTTVKYVVEIPHPVARHEKSPVLVYSPQYTARKIPSGTKEGNFSFGDLEKKIKDGSTVFTSSESFKPLKPSKPRNLTDQNVARKGQLPKDSTPSTPTKPSKAASVSDVKPIKPLKPLKPALASGVKPTKEAQPTSESSKSSSFPKSAPFVPLKPVKPLKPALKSFESQDAHELKQQILRLSPTKNNVNTGNQIRKYETRDSMPVLKPVKPAKPAALDVPEALQALSRLKPAKPTKPAKYGRTEGSKENTKEVTQAEIKAEFKPKEKQVVEAPVMKRFNPSNKQTDFHAKLSNIMRASTEPSLTSSSVPTETTLLRRTQSSTTSTKLTHPNKSRAKGPKRKLPKNMCSGGSTPTSASSVVSVSTLSTAESGVSTLESKPFKKRPPIKAKKPNLEVHRRVVSGELFL